MDYLIGRKPNDLRAILYFAVFSPLIDKTLLCALQKD
jgi:hypothetical protein